MRVLPWPRKAEERLAQAVVLLIERGVTDDSWLAHPPLTSCRAARILTGCGLAPVVAQGLGTPTL